MKKYSKDFRQTVYAALCKENEPSVTDASKQDTIVKPMKTVAVVFLKKKNLKKPVSIPSHPLMIQNSLINMYEKAFGSSNRSFLEAFNHIAF